MSERFCIRGCARPGQHYAACDDFGREDGDGACTGCVEVEARDGALICNRCYGMLMRRLEAAPDLIEHLRMLTHNVGSARRYDRERTSGSTTLTRAPVNVDLLDATRDIMTTIYAGDLAVDATPAQARTQALGGLGSILAHFDAIANDVASLGEWWQIVMSPSLPDAPEFWTISRALAHWPTEDRGTRWAITPCPECDLRTVAVTAPARHGSATWYTCRNCDWTRSDRDDDGLYALTHGPYDENRPRADTKEQM